MARSRPWLSSRPLGDAEEAGPPATSGYQFRDPSSPSLTVKLWTGHLVFSDPQWQKLCNEASVITSSEGHYAGEMTWLHKKCYCCCCCLERVTALLIVML